MALDLDTIYKNVEQMDIPDGYMRYTIRMAIENIKALGLHEELVDFYPQGIFTKKMLRFYLFHQTNFTVVTFEIVKKTDNLIHFHTYDYNKIHHLKYSLNNQIGIYSELHICLDTDEKFVFNSINDTNSHWARRFKNKIDDIYKRLK